MKYAIFRCIKCNEVKVSNECEYLYLEYIDKRPNNWWENLFRTRDDSPRCNIIRVCPGCVKTSHGNYQSGCIKNINDLEECAPHLCVGLHEYEFIERDLKVKQTIKVPPDKQK